CEVAKPPTTLIREALVKEGLLFVGVGSELVASAKTLWDLADFFGDSFGASPTDKLMEFGQGDEDNLVLFLNAMDETPHDTHLAWSKVAIANNKPVRFSTIATALNGVGVTPLNTLIQATKKQARSALSNPVKKRGFFKKAGAKLGSIDLNK